MYYSSKPILNSSISIVRLKWVWEILVWINEYCFKRWLIDLNCIHWRQYGSAFGLSDYAHLGQNNIEGATRLNDVSIISRSYITYLAFVVTVFWWIRSYHMLHLNHGKRKHNDQMLGCGAHVRIIALPHVRCACGSACGKGFATVCAMCVRAACL